MHVLIVAWGYPPSRQSGVHRPVAMTRWLIEHGHQVTVLTADEHYFELYRGIDADLLGRLPADRLRILRVPFAPERDAVLNRWPARRARAPRAWGAQHAEASLSAFPDPRYHGWVERIGPAALALHRQHPIDLCIATGNPYVSYLVPQALHESAGVPYVIDDRDTFVFDVYTGEPSPYWARSADWWQHLGRRALEMWVVNPPIADLYRSTFPDLADRIRVVENGWDNYSLDVAAIRGPRSGPVIFGYIGVINPAFPLRELIDGWVDQRGRNLPADAELHLYGPLGYTNAHQWQRDLLDDAQRDGVHAFGLIPKTEVQQAYRSMSALVFAREGGHRVTSSKIYEYTATGLPLAVVAPEGHDSRRVLAGYPRAHIYNTEDPAGWSKAIGAAWNDIQAGDDEVMAQASEQAIKYRRDVQLNEPMQRVLNLL